MTDYIKQRLNTLEEMSAMHLKANKRKSWALMQARIDELKELMLGIAFSDQDDDEEPRPLGFSKA